MYAPKIICEKVRALLSPYVYWFIVRISARRYVERSANIFDDNIGMLSDGHLNIARDKFKIAVCYLQVKIQLIHLIIDRQISSFIVDIYRGRRGESKLEFSGSRSCSLLHDLSDYILTDICL